jgi:hypothetical protein
MVRCKGIKRDGSPCTVTVNPPDTYCWWHDPSNAEQRRKAASRGGARAGRGRPLTQLNNIKEKILEVTEKVEKGRYPARGCCGDVSGLQHLHQRRSR